MHIAHFTHRIREINTLFPFSFIEINLINITCPGNKDIHSSDSCDSWKQIGSKAGRYIEKISISRYQHARYRISKVFLISPSRISIKENGNNVFISLILCVKCAMCMHVYDFHLLG